MGRYFSRYKPVGWRGDSQRHYLAAKGIKTKHKYLAPLDSLKGNRPESPTGSSNLLHAFYQEGYSDEGILARRNDPAFAEAAKDIERKRVSRVSGKKFDVPEADESSFPSEQQLPMTGGMQETLPTAPIPEEMRSVAPAPVAMETAEVEPEQQMDSEQPAVGTTGNVVITPGVPPPPPTLSDSGLL
jgi:hypothetical protein